MDHYDFLYADRPLRKAETDTFIFDWWDYAYTGMPKYVQNP